MLNLAVLFAGIFASEIVDCLPSPSLDIDTILELAKIRDKEKDLDRNNKFHLDTPEENNNHYGLLKSQEIIELIQKAKQDKVLDDWENDKNDYREADAILKELHKRYNKKFKKETNGHYYDRNKDLDKNELEEDVNYNHKHNDDEYKQSRYNDEALEQLLSSDVLDKKYYNKPKLVPSNLVGSYDLENYMIDDNSNADEYSKIFIILNPEAVEKSSNKEQLNNLLKNVLSMTSSQIKHRKKRNRERRYKGFPIKTELLSRRVRHDSREMYGVKDSMEEDYKPKRIRNDRGGGGGGGRTAIPYIKNRGDIYERDH